jgi:glyoxalase family protein
MKLEGIHHITAITGDAPANVDFYAGVLGLRLVKKTVNQDDPTIYHLFYADEQGSPGADLTFFEYPGAMPGVAGAGMVHSILWRVGAEEALDFWQQRLAAHDVSCQREETSLRFSDREGLRHQLVLDRSGDAALIAETPGIPSQHALRGFEGVRAYAADPSHSERLLRETLGFERKQNGQDEQEEPEHWQVRGQQRGGFYAYDPAPEQRPRRLA